MTNSEVTNVPEGQAKPKLKCFVISPIGKPGSPENIRSDQVFRHIIEPAATAMGYSPKRSDHLSTPGIITNQIIEHLLDSDLVIADLTENNPNVFYELAIRHASGKPVIPITSDDGSAIPFDNNQVRTIFYNHKDLDSAEACKKQIIEHIKTIQEGKEKSSNPLTTAINLEKLRESPDPEARQTGEILSAILEIQNALRTTGGFTTNRKRLTLSSYTKSTIRNLESIYNASNEIYYMSERSEEKDQIPPETGKRLKELSSNIIGRAFDTLEALKVMLDESPELNEKQKQEAKELLEKADVLPF